MTCACKMYMLAALVTPIVVVILVLIRLLEKKILRLKHPANYEVKFKADNENVDSICKKLFEILPVKALRKQVIDGETNLSEIRIVIQIKEERPIDFIYLKLGVYKNISAISIRELNDKE